MIRTWLHDISVLWMNSKIPPLVTPPLSDHKTLAGLTQASVLDLAGERLAKSIVP